MQAAKSKIRLWASPKVEARNSSYTHMPLWAAISEPRGPYHTAPTINLPVKGRRSVAPIGSLHFSTRRSRRCGPLRVMFVFRPLRWPQRSQLAGGNSQ